MSRFEVDEVVEVQMANSATGEEVWVRGFYKGCDEGTHLVLLSTSMAYYAVPYNVKVRKGNTMNHAHQFLYLTADGDSWIGNQPPNSDLLHALNANVLRIVELKRTNIHWHASELKPDPTGAATPTVVPIKEILT